MRKFGKIGLLSAVALLFFTNLLTGCVVSNQDILIIQEDLSRIKRQVSSLEDTINRKLASPATSVQPKSEQNLAQEIRVTQENQADIKIKLEDLGSNVQVVRSKIDELNYQLNGINQRLDNLDMKMSTGPGSSQMTAMPGTAGYPPTGMTSQYPGRSEQVLTGLGSPGSLSGSTPQSRPGSTAGMPYPSPLGAATTPETALGGQSASIQPGGPQSQTAAPAQPGQEQRGQFPTSPSPVAGRPGTQIASIPPQQIYQTAYQDYVNKNYELAILGFREFLGRNAASPLADNAQYWIGESYYSLGKYNDAMVEFNRVIVNYPNSAKKYAALLKVGYSLVELKRTEEGVRELQNLIKQHPQTEEAKLAEAKLKSLQYR